MRFFISKGTSHLPWQVWIVDTGPGAWQTEWVACFASWKAAYFFCRLLVLNERRRGER